MFSSKNVVFWRYTMKTISLTETNRSRTKEFLDSTSTADVPTEDLHHSFMQERRMDCGGVWRKLRVPPRPYPEHLKCSNAPSMQKREQRWSNYLLTVEKIWIAASARDTLKMPFAV